MNAIFDNAHSQRVCSVARTPPDTVIATHPHAFGVEAVVRQGAMCLHLPGNPLHRMPGDGSTLSAGVPHDERDGAEGAAYWVARRNAS